MYKQYSKSIAAVLAVAADTTERIAAEVKEIHDHNRGELSRWGHDEHTISAEQQKITSVSEVVIVALRKAISELENA
jgi:hypothetical protein